MLREPTYKELEQRVKELEREAHDLKQAEEALRESEEKFKNLYEEAPVGYMEYDTEGRISNINRTKLEMLGYTREEMMGHFVWDFVADKEETKKVIKAKLFGDLPCSKGLERTFIRRDGAKIHGLIDDIILKDDSGRITGVRGTFRDITDLRRVEKALQESNERINSIFTALHVGIMIIDPESYKIVNINPYAVSKIGVPREEIIGKACKTYICSADTDKSPIAKLAQGVNYSEHFLLNKNNEKIPILKTAIPHMIDGKEYIIENFTDISEYKRAEEEKKKLEVRLQYAQKMESIGTLAGGIAHNFNNLLMGIQGNASLMLFDIDPDHPHNNNLKNIEKLIQNGSRLTAQLLGYAREGKYEVMPLDLNQLVENTSDTFGTTRKEIRVHRELDENLHRIRADKGQMEEVLLNLFVNAADAMQGGGDLFLRTMNVTHEVMDNKEYHPKPGNYVLFSAMDTGMGMDEETMKRIFEPFFTTKGLASSTGLGLASAYGIVKGHGGYIDVDSEKGKGTTFSIYIPVIEGTVKEGKEVLGEQSNGKETVLLIDDEELVLEAGEQMLKKLGYDVLTASNGQKALDLFTQNQDTIGVVLIDMIMPGMGGGEAYDRMKRIAPDIKAILISGYGIDGQATEILKRGCNAFIQKPFDMELLSRSISKILNKG